MKFIKNHLKSVIPVTIVVLLAMGSLLVLTNHTYADNRAPELSSISERPITSLRDLNKAMIDIAAEVKPAVVTVSTERTMTMQSNPFMGDPFFKFFFDQNNSNQNAPNQEYHQRGLGSGVIVSDDGTILTNNHVIADADSIYVRTYDGKRYTAEVVGADEQTDIAVLKIDEKNLPYISPGNSDDLQVGEMVLAVGSPMSENLAYTVTQGIVSAVGRSNVGLADYENFIQTDAAINPGNSGGPLINLDGNLIGINTAIASRSGGFQGIGFAIPINMAEHVKNSLLAEGRVIRGWLGVSIQDLNEDLAEAMDLNRTNGALVGDVVPDGPADKAGLKSGDVIIALNGVEVNSSSVLRNRIAASDPGTSIDLKILRDGKEKNERVTLGELNPEMASLTNPNWMQDEFGFSLAPLTPEFRSNYGLDKNVDGVGVANVTAGSKAYSAGIQPGDVILAVNRNPVKSVDDFNTIAKSLKKGDTMLLKDYRDGYGFYVAISV